MPRIKPKCEDCEYVCVYEGWEDSTYECKVCGDRYKIYEDEMK